jgi:small subunit ribosomal protein S4
MGDPKFPRRSYDTPSHPWQGERIKEEAIIVQQYGLKNKKELWKAKTILRELKKQSRDLQARLRTGEPQAVRETDLLLKRCARMGLLPMEGATLDDVLGLGTESMLGRRLQTIVIRKGLASSPNQARQMIVHGHISIEGRKVTIPGYTVSRGEEDLIAINAFSPIANEMHPVRVAQKEVFENRLKNPPVERPREDPRDRRGGGGRGGGRGGFRSGGGKPTFVKHVPKEIVKTAAVDAQGSAPIPEPTEEGQ